ncbi:MAG: hypothetical protein PWQ82_1215 [Thermosediminibacterales bacterium]|nr:hypothetical protein [Thermosediminibacterales bacterium]MDK2836645.1 hypothetical protein [Thermosediminibacterales bacterium]
MKSIRIGSGAGYGGDRIEPAVELIEKGNLDYIVFECLAERTIAIAQQAKLKNPNKGYNSLLEDRMEKILPLCYEKDVKIITNMGAANPIAATKIVKQMATEKGLKGLKIAAVLGDNIFENINKYLHCEVLETGSQLKDLNGEIVSANVYLGCEGIVEALENGSDVVITGRVADPALFLAPIVFEHKWDVNNYDLIGKGILIGHLLECAAQITGGFFADPGYKDVPDLWKVGFPIAEVFEDGEAIITKVKGSGGCITTATCKEQLLYEIHDPSKYITPDGVADFTNVTFEEIGKDKIKVKGGRGTEKPKKLKVSVGYRDCYIGEGEISYGGSGALNRAKLAGEIVKKRLEHNKVSIEELRIDLIGVNSLYRNEISRKINREEYNPPEVRLRVAGRTLTKDDAIKIGNEVETLYTNGPASGGGVTKSVKEIISIASIFIPREDVKVEVVYEEV